MGKASPAARVGIGPLLVGTASILWATDALFRFPAVNAIDPVFIVLVEHGLGTAALLAPLALIARGGAFAMGAGEWVGLLLIGAGGSALATVFFTISFLHVNPSVAILLQKLQPVLVVILSYLFLGERPGRRFAVWAPAAFLSALWLSFPDLDFGFLRGGLDVRARGVFYALAAAGLWAVSTVLGKAVLNQVPPLVATFWRFAFGLLTLAGLFALSGASVPWHALGDRRLAESLAYIALIPGVAAMLAYYAGLRRTTASLTTFVELLFPVGAVVLNTIFLGAALEPRQLVAGAALLTAVTLMSRE
jgi:drug/metabolite transporter (DMT)-like permease